MSKYSKKRIDWVDDSTAPDPSWADLGYLSPDTSHNQETAQEETSGGEELYAGTQETYEVVGFEETQFTALKAVQDADGTVDLRIRSLGSDAAEIEVGFSVKCRMEKMFQPRARQKYHYRFVRTFI